MIMFKTLLKIQLKNLLYHMQKNNGRRGSAGLVIGLLIFVMVCMEFMFVALWMSLLVFCEIGLSWLYFAMSGLVALALAVFGSVFMTQTQLYDAKDNELLLSMPVRPMQILMSRMAVLLVMTGIFSLAVLLPAFVIYGVCYGATVLMVLGWLLTSVSVILLAQSLCCALGWVLHQLLSRIRNKAAVSLVYMVLFLGAYFYFYANANTLLAELAQNGEKIAVTVKDAVWPLYALGLACTGDPLNMLLVLLLCAGVFALVCRLLALSFAKTVSGGQRSASSGSRTAKSDLRVKTPVRTIAHKELRKFLTSPVYLTNFGFGLILLAALPVLALIFRSDLLTLLKTAGIPDAAVPGLITVSLAFCIATSCISAPSVSLEGKSLWILRSLPVSGKTVLLGKLRMHCTMLVPLAAVCAAALGVILGCGVLDILLVTAISALFGWFVGCIGLILNLMTPRFDWINEAGPCKQSAAVFLTIFGSYLVMLLFAAVFAALLFAGVPGTACLALVAAAVLALSAGAHALLTHWGARKFESL